MVQWAPFLLDRFVAPKCSDVTACLAPEIAEPSNYFWSLFFNSALVAPGPDNTRSLTFVFLRRLAEAVRAYRAGREAMLECVGAQQHSNDAISGYLKALSSFEGAIVSAYLALITHDTVGRIIAPTSERSFEKGDGSPCQRLNALYNALKHFDDNVLRGRVPDVPTPIWLVNDGIECVGSEGDAMLKFSELVDVLSKLGEDARFLAEDVYRRAVERRKNKAASAQKH